MKITLFNDDEDHSFQIFFNDELLSGCQASLRGQSWSKLRELAAKAPMR
jgi:hypothetical protein